MKTFSFACKREEIYKTIGCKINFNNITLHPMLIFDEDNIKNVN